MEIIELKDRIIYRASKGKKVKFVDDESNFNEIVIKLNRKTKKEIVEVDE